MSKELKIWGAKVMENRVDKAIKNSVITFGCQIVYLIVSFISRTIFTYLLGTEYLGISGLFTNIITLLSFAELGIGTALVYRMYEPLATGNYRKLSQLLNFYKQVYRIIICIIAAVGIFLIPFIPYLVDVQNVEEDIRILYILYLIQAIVSYIYVYKKSLLIADQKNYIVNIYTQVFNIIQNVAQILVLLIIRNYVLYLLISIICNLLNNIFCAIKVDKEYKIIKKYESENIEKKEMNSLLKDVKGLMLTKIATTIYSGTDSLFISKFIGVIYVGILSNYTLFLTIINNIMNKIFESLTASLGNKIANGEKKELPDVIKKMFFLNIIMYGFICVCMILLLEEFVTKIWLTDEYYLPEIVVMTTIIELFMRSIHYPVYITRNALGSFSEYKIIMLFLAFLNIFLDYIWVKPLGIFGLYMATIICRGITYVLDIYTVYRIRLGVSSLLYYKYLMKWMLFLSVYGIFMYKIKLSITFNGLLGLILYGCIFFLIYIIMIFVLFHKSEEFLYCKEILRHFHKQIL